MQMRGFTLVELVVVIIVLGIVGTVTSRYLVYGSEIYVDARARQEAVASVRYATERIRRDLHSAVPNSVRIQADNVNNRQCVEFVPILDSGSYLDLPRLPSETTMDVVMFTSPQATEGDRLWVYAEQASQVYAGTQRWQTVQGIASGGSGTHQITFNGAPQFSDDSPVRRFYIGRGAVSYCLRNNSVYRHSGYGWNATQQVFTSGGVLIAEGLNNSVATQPPFSDAGVAGSRFSQLLLDWRLETDSGEPLEVYHALHIANVP